MVSFRLLDIVILVWATFTHVRASACLKYALKGLDDSSDALTELEKMTRDCQPRRINVCAEQVHLMFSKVMDINTDVTAGVGACSHEKLIPKCVGTMQEVQDAAKTSDRSATILKLECTSLKSIHACHGYAAAFKHYMKNMKDMFTRAAKECEAQDHDIEKSSADGFYRESVIVL